MNLNDTIVALATPNGVGAIAVIRVSGSKAISIIDMLFTSVHNKKLKQQKTHTIHLGFLKNKTHILDEVLVSVFKNPQSYTGEDVVEISCHGSSYIQQEIIQLCIEKGCRLANPGEFTLRAFLNGKMDLAQAEAVADVIASNSAASHQLAIQQMRGGITNEIKTLRAQLIEFVALMELELDFAEEDVTFADRTKFSSLVQEIEIVLKQLLDSFSLGNALKNGIPITILGAPNVGKSTLLNALLNEERAIVSNIAGTTRDTIEDEVVLNGIRFRFIDTAGIRKTNDAIESIGIQKAMEKAAEAQLIIQVIEASSNPESFHFITSQSNELQQKFPDKKVVLLINKIDVLTTLEQEKLTAKYPNAIVVSAKEKIGINTLKKTLSNLVEKGSLNTSETIVTNARHYEALHNALQAIQVVKEGINNQTPTDLIAIDVRETLQHLGTITGDYDIDKDILSYVFSSFCIGK